MKSYNVTFENGSFLETGTGKRIIPQQGKTYVLAGDDDAFAKEDTRLAVKSIIKPEEKYQYLVQKYPNHDFHLLLNENEKLYFKIKLIKNLDEKDYNEYFFKVTIVDPLYMYKRKDNDGYYEKNWRLADCNVRLEECIGGKLVLTEKIEMSSLNSLYAAVIQFYFAFKRSTATNVFKTFYYMRDSKQELIGDLRLAATLKYKKLKSEDNFK